MDILTVGETMALVAPSDPVHLDQATSLRLSTAGAESNVAVCAAQLGVRVRWATRLGDDALGHHVRATIARLGVDVHAELDENAPTGVMFKDPGENGSSTSIYYRSGSAASHLSYDDLARAADTRVGVLHLTGVTPALSSSCHTLVDTALRTGHEIAPRISFDVNYRPRLWRGRDAATELGTLANLADIVFVGLDEGSALWGTTDPFSLRARLPHPDVVVVKDADVGVTIFRDETSTFVPALPDVRVVEAIGAGDAFAGAFLSALVRGLDDRECGRLGHLAAASALSTTTDHASLPPLEGLLPALNLPEEDWPAAAHALLAFMIARTPQP